MFRSPAWLRNQRTANWAPAGAHPPEPRTADSFPLPLSDNVPQLIPEPGTPLHSRVLQYRELLDSLPMDAYTHGCILHPELTTDSMIPKYATAEIRSKSPLGQGAGGTAPRPFLQARQGKWQSRAAGELQVPWGAPHHPYSKGSPKALGAWLPPSPAVPSPRSVHPRTALFGVFPSRSPSSLQ